MAELHETNNPGLIRPVNPQVEGHFRDYSEALNRESDRIKRDYRMHSGEAGRSRETAVRDFFLHHLASALGVKEGFVIDSKGGVSKQSDLLIVDEIWNKPIGIGPNPFWLRESVYASIEIKTNLDPTDIDDAIQKCKAFKTLQPDWTNCGNDFARQLLYDPRVSMQLKVVIALLLLTASLGFADTDAELSRKILGTWSERNHEVTYLQNGKWRLAKNGDVSPGVFRWHIKDGNLILFRDGVTFPPRKIVWVTKNEFFLQDDQGGQSAPYYRHSGN